MATQKLPRAYSKETMELANQRAPKATKRSVKNRSITEEALSHATSFAEYSALKKKQEAEEGMRSAAEKLNVLTATKTKSLPRAYDSSTISIIGEHAPSTITAAQAPADFGVSPEKYVQSIKAINYKHDDETQSFFDKYFGGKVPTEEEYRTTYRNLIDQGKLTEDEMMSFHANQDMLRTATEAEQKRNEAFELLGKDAKNFSGLSESEMYERFAEMDNNADEVAQEYADYAQKERNGFGELKYMLEVGPKAQTVTAGVLRPDLYGAAENPEMPDSSVLAYANMTPEQRKTYLYLAGEYGEKTATDYFDSLIRDDGFNKQAYEMRDEALRKEADEDAVRATLYSILAAPTQLAGSAYAINQGLTGQEIDPYHSAFAAGQMVQTPRTEVSQNITEKLGKVDEETGEIKDTFGSVMARGAYNAATSMSDSIMASALGLGIPGASAVLQGGMQFGNSVQDAVLRDGNNGQALRLATVNALIEAGTEWLPADNLIKAVKDGNIKTIKDFGWNMVKSILGEGPGEGLSELGSTLADKAIMQSMSEWEQIASTEGEDAAARNMWKNIGEAMLAGTISGAASGMLGGTASYTRNRNVQLELEAAARQLEEDQKKTVPEAQQPHMPAPETKAVDAREQLMAEYGREDERAEERMQREDERGYMPEPAQEEAQQAETAEDREEAMPEEKPEETASEGEKEQRFTQARGATVRDEDGVESRVNVVGVMMDDGTPVLVTEDENGETDYALADDLIFDDEMGELLGYEGVKNMDARGLRSYLEGWDGQTAPEEYARAYASVYQRAGAGLDYDQAAMQNEAARSNLSEDARMSAYAAGLNAYNQTHDTVPAASIENAKETVDENVQMSAKETPKGGRLSRRYSQAKFSQLGKKGRNNAVAQMELLAALASRTGHTIVVVDSIVSQDGKRANATYNPKTREIRVALDATGGAYAYAAMHELTHAVRNEHASEWDGFKSFVRDGLKANGQNWNELVKYQMEHFGYNQETAEEEVICNTVPALLQDERNVLKLYKGNRTLFNRVVDWVKGLLQDVKTAGKQLSTRSQSWAQMDALKNDRELLQGMYDRLMAVMEKPGESNQKGDEQKLSANDQNFVEDKYFARQMDHIGDLKKGGYVVVGKITNNSPLNQVGIPDGTLYFDNNKMLAEIENHADHLNGDVLKQIPAMLDKPIAISQFKRENTVSVYGSMNHNGTPIVVGVMIAKNRTGTASIAKIRTVHARADIANQITNESILYLNPNKKETIAWFQARGIHVPLGGKRFGFIRSIAEKGENVKFSMQDSEGNELSEKQQEYFAESKVRDDEGRLMVMYHGTPSGNYEKFKTSTYFTPMEWYADVYQNPGASSISYGKKNDAPKTFSAYLNITKPFDTRNPKERRIFQQEYYRQWGTGAPLSESGLPDWTDGMDLQEFIEEMGYDYDGLILDEGGVPDDKGGVKSRGLSYVIFDPIQAKLTENKMPTDDERFMYSLRDTDENVQDALSAQQQAFRQVRSHRITAAEADKLAGEMLKAANSDYDRQKLAAEISRIYDYIERGEDISWEQADDEMTTLMARVMEKSKTLDLEHEEMAKPIRDYLRKTGIRLTASQRKEAESLAGSYGAYRRGLFGRVRLVSTGGTPLDSLWGELNGMNSELFPEGVSEGEMTSLLMYAVDALKPVYHTGKGMNVEESASWLSGKLNEAYFNLPAVKAAAKDARTFGQSIRDLKNAMKRFEETSWSEYQNALQSIKEARTAEKRTQKQQETEAMRAKYQSWRDRDTAARKEREMKAKYRAKIERTANVLSGWLMKPTDAKHVPAAVEDSVRRMIASLDFSGKDTKVAGELSARINSMADALLQAQEGEDENRTIFLERDQQMIDELRRVAELIRGNTEYQQMEGRGVYDLNGMELRELSKWLDVVRHVVTETSKLRGSNLPGESVEQVAQLSMVEMSGKKAWKDKKWATKRWLEHFGPDMQDSFTFFERMGPTANAIFKGLRSGFDKVTQLTRQAEKHTKTILEGVDLKELTGKKAKKQTFTLQKGGQLEMTKAQIMELYVLSKREQAQGHIYGEGIRIQGDEDARARQLTKADVAAITGTLTEDEKRVADGLQKFLSRECASWGNETSMKLLGYRKFGEEFYWPIRTDSNTRNTTRLEDNYAANISAIKNQGMTKATIEGAKNAIVVGDIFDTYTRHISNMAAYAGYALPLSDFTRWYNSRGVKTEIEQMMGKKGIEYINNFLMAVNGSSLQASRSGIEKLAGVMTRNAKIASVGANARVVIQQPTSYARAAMYMSPKYLTGALTMKRPDGDLINRYCGIAQWKNWGFYETNIGPNLRQMIVGDETAADRMREVAMKPAALGDQWTLNHLWNACELETRELYPELEQGSEAYYQQVGERMSEVIDRTQVVDSVFHRSQMMRSKSGTAQMLTNFMSEPTKTYNMLMSAISDYADNRKNKAARNRVARALTVYAVTGLMTAAASAVIDALRDDDAEKEWAEKYLNAMGDNAKDNLNPLGLLPGVKDILSLLEGYEPSRLDTQSIQRILWAAQEIEKYANGTSKQNLYGVINKVMQAVSSTLGIPLSNLMRDGNAIIQTVTGESPTLTAEAQKAGKVTRLYNALESGEKEKAKKLREELRLKAGMTPKEIDTAIAKKLEADPKIKEAYDAKTERNFADMNRAINALTAKGFGKEAVEKAISSYASNQKPKETKAKDPGEQLSVTFYTEADVVSAMKVLAGIEKGGSVTEADVKAMISERVAGSEAKDPEKSVKSGIQSEMKKAYLEAEAKGNTTAMKKLGMVMKNVLGTTQETMDDWVKSQHADNLRTAVDSSNKTAALKAVTAMRRDGKTDSEIKSSLSKYKQLYIDAVNRKDMATANRIKTMLQSLDLKSKKGASLYTDKHFEDWLKEK